MAEESRSDLVDVIVYPWHESGAAPSNDGDKPFLTVYNRGSPEFASRGFDSDVGKIPWSSLYDKFFSKDSKQVQKDRNRGNFQVNFGIAGGQCHQQRNDPAKVLLTGGVAVPAKRKGTDGKSVQDAYATVDDMATRLGIPWAADNERMKGRRDMNYATNRHSNKAESLTIACNFLGQATETKEHRDSENCRDEADALIVSVICQPTDRVS